MFGTNDLGGVPPDEYDRKYREVVRKCLDNGTVVLLSTIPPRSGKLEQSRQFAEAVRTIGREMNVPVVDYFAEIVQRRPNDWDGSLPQFKDPADRDEYNVPTLISRDGVHPSNPKKHAGDYSEAGLKSNGYVLRNYVTLLGYAEVIRHVLKAG
jgi:lysophospholipase L1-like esterase